MTRRNSITFRVPAVCLALTTAMLLCNPAVQARRPDAETTKIVRAIDALDKAHEELKEAGHDFHGHKEAALDKVDKAKEVLVRSRDSKVEKAVDKIQDAIDELKACTEGDHKDDHPKIHAALHSLEEAKEQL